MHGDHAPHIIWQGISNALKGATLSSGCGLDQGLLFVYVNVQDLSPYLIQSCLCRPLH
tara:strand:+ start:1833 stop:2006 length:174 start_codon:yes stop_codon:yes gene_type:complete